MKVDPRERFGDRVADYVRFRPSYPIEIVRVLEREAGISAKKTKTERTRVCDLGSGTGISCELFLREGYAVLGVEPNAAMREASRALEDRYPRFTLVDGTAEQTTLEDQSCDLVIAAQAFHWFDRDRTRAEVRRVLAPGGLCALLWNERRVDTPFLRAYEDALLSRSADYARVRHENVTPAEIARFFGREPASRVAPNHQDFDRAGLIGRAMSSSYVPKEGPDHDALVRELERMFDEHNERGVVRFAYDTRLFFGPVV